MGDASHTEKLPNTIQIGDVQNIHGGLFGQVDLLLAGSPCQGFSAAGNGLNFEDPRSKLFFEFVRILKQMKPKYFLLENVRMKKEWQDIITQHLGVEPININSNLLSAQNRNRFYWANIPFKGDLTDRGIMLKDVLVDSIDDVYKYSQKSIDYMERGSDKWVQAGTRRADGYEQSCDKDKSFTITANWHKGVPYNYFKETREAYIYFRGRGNNPAGLRGLDGKTPSLTSSRWEQNNFLSDGTYYRKLTPVECERLQTVPDNYTDCVSNTQRYKMLGNGMTVDVIVELLRGMSRC